MTNIKCLLLAALFSLLSWQAQAACAAAGNCFWIGGTGTLDLATDSAHWSSTTGGATCSCEPTTTSQLSFDANSGGGTVTAAAGPFTFTQIILTGFTGTLDFATNNASVTNTSGLSDASGTHTFNMGSGTWTINLSQISGTTWNANNASLTFNAGSSTLIFNSTGTCTATQGGPTLSMGGKTYATVKFQSTSASCNFLVVQGSTFGTLTLIGPVSVSLPNNTTQTVNTALNVNGTSGNWAFLSSGALGDTATIAAPATVSSSWGAFRDITFTTNPVTATNCANLGHNSFNGGSCAVPSGGGGGGGGGIIGN
jgi:hypothetical protein